MRTVLSYAFIVLILAGCARPKPNRAAQEWSAVMVGKQIRPGPPPPVPPTPIVIQTPPTPPVNPPPPRTNAPTPIVTLAGSTIGKVVQVSPNGFVVLSYSLGSLPPIGARLNVYRKGLKVGELSVNGPQRDNNTIADIVVGECQPGDETRKD